MGKHRILYYLNLLNLRHIHTASIVGVADPACKIILAKRVALKFVPFRPDLFSVLVIQGDWCALFQ